MELRRSKTDFQKQAADYGIDLSLLDCNLARTPLERIHIHQEALNRMTLLKKAGEDARHRKTAPTPSGK